MTPVRRAIDFLTCRFRPSLRGSLALVGFCLLCVCAMGISASVSAGHAPANQQSVTTPGSPEQVAATLEQARQLQSEADRHIDAQQIKEALDQTERALALRRQHLGNVHPDVAYSIGRLGVIAYSQGQYDRAEGMFRDALRIREATLGPDHEDVADSLEDLASVLQVRGDYVQPERLYLQALGIYEKMLTRPPASVRPADIEGFIAGVRNNLGRLYYTKGDYDNAEAQYLNVVAIRERTRGADDPGVAAALANVGGVYYSARKYERAVEVLQRALGIQQKLLPGNHQSLATSSFNLAAVYFDQGDYRNAEPLFQRALHIDEQRLAPDHPNLAIRMVGLADVLRLEGEYARAAPLYERALSIREQALGPTHPDVAATLSAWSLLLLATGNLDGATDLMSRAAGLREETLALVLTTGSEQQKRLYLGTLADETDIAVSLHLGSAPTSTAAASLALTDILQRKGRSIDARADQIATLRRHLSEADGALLNRFTQTQSQLATIVLKGAATDQQEQSVATLRREIQQLEQAISARSSEFRVTSRKADLQAIQNALPGRAALIEYFSYRPFFVKNARNTAFGAPRYAAYILRSDGIAGSVDLGEAALIDLEVRRFRQALSIPAGQGVRRAGRTLHEAVMTPLEGPLQGVEQIIVSPDGTLNLIPFSALVGQNDKYLVEDFTISYVTSGRELTRLRDSGPNRSKTVTPPAIVANPLFDGRRVAPRATPVTQAATRGFDARVLEQARHFNALPGTAQEGAALAKVLPDARLYMGAAATEALLKQLKGPSILHIATHGFFLGSGAAPRAAISNGQAARVSPPGPTPDREDALVLSGLALAGVNQRSSGEGEDGLLTALEVAGLDLWGTRMVVLSACESGLGDVRDGEGVYGLRRALVLAGSESQVMSLWQVPDAATRNLMIAFYQRLRSSEGRAEALRNVQLAMLRGKSTYVHPFFWAGFILSGDWRPAFD